jgi:hypothetical protein
MLMLPTFRPGESFGLPSVDGLIRLRTSDAARLNALKAEIRRLGKLTATPPLYLSDEPPGRNLSLKGNSGFYAKLSGASSPYSFVEQVGTAGGTWAAAVGGNVGTANAYEVNGVAGLANDIVWLESGYPGDYRFQWVSFATPCSGNFQFGLTGCGAAVPGATITLTLGGTTVATGTTDISGNLSLHYSSAGTYNYTITKTNCRTITGSITATCSNQNILIANYLDANPGGTTLTLTTSLGAITLTQVGGSQCQWSGPYTWVSPFTGSSLSGVWTFKVVGVGSYTVSDSANNFCTGGPGAIFPMDGGPNYPLVASWNTAPSCGPAMGTMTVTA